MPALQAIRHKAVACYRDNEDTDTGRGYSVASNLYLATLINLSIPTSPLWPSDKCDGTLTWLAIGASCRLLNYFTQGKKEKKDT